ncbi:MAG: HNH endonuclease [Clostridiales bacterium]|nr:HNH endonuclease [Clostridiales bacterium]
MQRSCSYCGRVHPVDYICPKKPKRQRETIDTKQQRFRATAAWRKKSKQIMQRDTYLCQACLHELPGTIRKYNSVNLSVHHIVPLSEDYSRRLDDDNLITLCSGHHSQADRGVISRRELREMISPRGSALS